VRRSELKELHYITPIANMPSIIRRGILCKNQADRFDAASIALQSVQDTRDKKSVPGGLQLHEYANLYFSARNPMMFKRQALHREICVLRISTDVLDAPNVVIADCNAASKYSGFWPAPAALARIDSDWVFAEYWTDPDQITQWRKAAAKCAEVLVPRNVAPGMILGAYVSCEHSKSELEAAGFTGTTEIDGHMFFLRG
jgi:hypothetical protein